MLQFHLSRLFGTQFKTHGVAIANAAGIRLVFREGEAPPQIDDDEIQSVLITWNNFDSIVVKRGFLGHRVTIKVRSASELKGVPGLNEDQVELSVHRKNVGQLEPFERQVARYRSGNVDEDVDQFVDNVRDMLDGY